MKSELDGISFRRACPEDVRDIAALIYESSPELNDFMFRLPTKNPVEFIERDYLRGGGVYGYRNQFVVVSGGEITATMTCYRGGQAVPLFLNTLVSAFKFFSFFEFIKVVFRLIQISDKFSSPKWDAVFLANGCVRKSERNKGIFPHLMTFSAQICRNANTKFIEFDVSKNNPRAQQLWERLGYKVINESTSSARISAFRRMRKEI